MDPKSLKQIEQLINKSLKDVTRKDDLKSFATKNDLLAMKDEIINEISDVINGFGESIDERKANKTDVAVLEGRMTIVEEKLAA